MEKSEAVTGDCNFKYDVKTEMTSKGIRITVHARDDSLQAAASDAVTLYEAVQNRLKDGGHQLAPVEMVRQ